MTDIKEKPIVIYDINVLPDGVDIDKIITKFKEENTVLWDSRSGGHEPKVINVRENNTIIKDVNEKE